MLGRVLALFILMLTAAPAVAAAPPFPPLSGRVVDAAGILTPQTEAQLTAKLAGLEQATSRQLVVVTLPTLDDTPIEDYGYQLGRHWGIGQKGANDGALFIVAPADRQVRIEVGYGLEGVLTDALSSVILQSAVLPRFKAGDMEGGVVAGTDAIVQQLSLPDGEAKARVAQAAQAQTGGGPSPLTILIIVLVVFFLFGGMGRRRSALPWIILGGLSGGGRGGGWSGGGGGFGGGGGSFGGGGSSGRW